MITQPDQIGKSSDWDGLSENAHSISKVLNLDSKMDFKEHQRIVFEARRLLAGPMNLGDKSATPAGKALALLKNAYESSDADYVLKISKGIHQPTSNPHMQLKLKHGGKKYLYHLDVSMSEERIEGLSEEYFHWEGVQFSAKFGDDDIARWPLMAAVKAKPYARRRMSIAPDGIKDEIERLAAVERARQAESQRREDQAKRDRDRNQVNEKLRSLNYTLIGPLNAGLDKLLAGHAVSVTTKTRKTISIKWLPHGAITNA